MVSDDCKKALVGVIPSPVNNKSPVRLFIGSEEDGCRKYPLETFHDSVVSLAVFEEVEEIEDFGGCAESDNAAALADGHDRNPDRDESILTVRKAKLRMTDDLKEEFAVAPGVR